MELVFIFPILAAFSVVFLLIIKIYLKIRESLPVSVNCWFCNQNTKVQYHQTNSWICSSCDQYNGFGEDGGYNKLIAAQFDEHLNVPISSSEMTKFKRQGPTLCNSCNINQQLKVDQLASFVPFNVNNYDNEIDVYSKQLNKVYDICETCKRMLSELFKKEKELYPELYKKSSVFESTEKKNQSRSKTLYYVNILSCTPLLLDVIISNTLKHASKSSLKSISDFAVMPDWMNVSTFEHIFDKYYVNYRYNIHIALIAFCIFMYLIVFIRRRSFLNLLNVSAWSILLSLKYFSTTFDDHILLLQGCTAAVFLFLNLRSNSKVTLKRRVSEKITCKRKEPENININLKSHNNIPSKTVPRVTTTVSAFAAVNKSRDQPKTEAAPQKLPEFTSARVTRSSSKLLKPKDDFGLSNLHLGTRKHSTAKNHLLAEPKPFLNSSNDLWNGNTVLSPPRLNVSDLASTPTPPRSSMYDYSPTLTRCSSPTSGIGSMSPTLQPQERLFEQDYENFPHSPLSNHSHSQLMQSNFYTPCNPVYQHLAVTPYTYYQFAAMFHRMCTPPPSPSSFSSDFNNSNKTITEKSSQCSHNMCFIVLICIVVFCNFILTGIMYYKEFIASEFS